MPIRRDVFSFFGLLQPRLALRQDQLHAHALKLQGRRQAVAFPDDVALLERLDAAEVPRTAAGPALAGKYQLRKRRSLKRTQNT